MNSDIDNSIRKQQRITNYLNELNFALEPLYRFDFKRLEKLREIIKDLEKEVKQSGFPENMETVTGEYERINLIGLLPLMLTSRELFPNHKSLIEFSKNVLSIRLKDFGRPARTRIVGEILTEVAKLPKGETKEMLEKLHSFIRNKIVHGGESFFIEWDSTIRRMRSGQ